MKLLIKQRVFSVGDTYDIYDESGNVKYFVKEKIVSVGYNIYIYDENHNEVAVIHQKIISLLPVFEIQVNGSVIGSISKKLTLFQPEYKVDFNGWWVEGDMLGWDYKVYNGFSPVAQISKELFRWGDTYVIDFTNPEDELYCILLVIAIDAANRSNK